MKVAIRGFADKKRIFEEVIDADLSDLASLCKSHMERLLKYPKHMIEFEFLEESNRLERFFRFGTDPSGMVMPYELPLNPPEP